MATFFCFEMIQHNDQKETCFEEIMIRGQCKYLFTKELMDCVSDRGKGRGGCLISRAVNGTFSNKHCSLSPRPGHYCSPLVAKTSNFKFTKNLKITRKLKNVRSTNQRPRARSFSAAALHFSSTNHEDPKDTSIFNGISLSVVVQCIKQIGDREQYTYDHDDNNSSQPLYYI
jgi:hypothetical protein